MKEKLKRRRKVCEFCDKKVRTTNKDLNYVCGEYKRVLKEMWVYGISYVKDAGLCVIPRGKFNDETMLLMTREHFGEFIAKKALKDFGYVKLP